MYVAPLVGVVPLILTSVRRGGRAVAPRQPRSRRSASPPQPGLAPGPTLVDALVGGTRSSEPRVRGCVRGRCAELAPGSDAELAEHVLEVPLNGPWAQEQACRNLRV